MTDQDQTDRYYAGGFMCKCGHIEEQWEAWGFDLVCQKCGYDMKPRERSHSCIYEQRGEHRFLMEMRDSRRESHSLDEDEIYRRRERVESWLAQ